MFHGNHPQLVLIRCQRLNRTGYLNEGLPSSVCFQTSDFIGMSECMHAEKAQGVLLRLLSRTILTIAADRTAQTVFIFTDQLKLSSLAVKLVKIRIFNSSVSLLITHSDEHLIV